MPLVASRRYVREELLSLRESPLVCRPANLPPVEEWMGPIPDQSQVQNRNGGRAVNRGRNDDSLTTDGATNRRSVFEARAKSSNAPEDIILGPPKTAFASAGTRNTGKNFDSSQRSSFNNQDDLNVRIERHVFSDKQIKEGQRNEREETKTRDSRPAAGTNRRSVKDDGDLWSNVRQTRIPGQDEGDQRLYRKVGDRDTDRNREGGRDGRGQRLFESHRRDGDKTNDSESVARRPGAGRDRNEPAWARDQGRDEEGQNGDPEATRVRDWRDKDKRRDRVPERDWNKGAKADMDPEWMDGPEPEDKKPRYTEDDLKAFMESMKTANGTAQEPSGLQSGQQVKHEQNMQGTGSSGIRNKVDTPLVVDSNFDGFFGSWKESKKEKDTVNSRNKADSASAPPAKSAKSSKFTGFFAPKPEPEPVKEQSAIPLFASSKDSSSEDKEGFQRILSLLGQQHLQNQQQNGSPHTPPRHQQPRALPPSPPFQSPQARENSEMYNTFGVKSSPGIPKPQARDSEFLLNLMKHAQQGRHDISQPNNTNRRVGQDTASSLLPFFNMNRSTHDTPQHALSNESPSSFFTDSLREELPIRDKLNPTSATESRGPPPGFYDPNYHSRQPSAGPSQHSGFPPGIHRPPGLEQYQQMQSQRPNMAPPPGFQAPARGQNGFPPGLMGNASNFGIPVNGRGMPPPGYMNGPPPGFPPHFSQEGLTYGGFGDVGTFGQGYLNGQQRRQ